MSDLESKPKKRQILGVGGSHSSGHEEGGEGNWLVSYADMMTLLVGFFVILNSFSTIDDEKFENARREITFEFGGTYQIPYKDIVDRLREELKKLGLGDQFVIKQTDAGVDISFLGTVFFNTGSADLKTEGKTLLSKLLPIVKKESDDFDITIEGHTDNVPVAGNSSFRNNWELSGLRSSRVLEAFEAAGFPKAHLTAVGYGDARPLVPNLDEAGKPIAENQSQNRRVIIKLIHKAQSTIGVTPNTDATPSGSAAPSTE